MPPSGKSWSGRRSTPWHQDCTDLQRKSNSATNASASCEHRSRHTPFLGRRLMMKRMRYMVGFVLGLLLGAVGQARAGVTGFVNHPTSNSVDFINAVNGLGGTVDSNVNWSTHPVGPLINTFYTGSDGVTFSTSGPINTVQNG